MTLSTRPAASSSKYAIPKGETEFDILRASHRFLRDDEREQSASWNDQLARKYYDSLYREFAVCDLKHYKSGNFSLRWRTETEVLSGAGESTCGNTRCAYHEPSAPSTPLTTLELPFAYEEHGEHKQALVKIVLCARCVRKIMWKREKERDESRKSARRIKDINVEESTSVSRQALTPEDELRRSMGSARRDGVEGDRERSHRRGNSRSLSPRRRRSEGNGHDREKYPRRRRSRSPA